MFKKINNRAAEPAPSSSQIGLLIKYDDSGRNDEDEEEDGEKKQIDRIGRR